MSCGRTSRSRRTYVLSICCRDHDIFMTGSVSSQRTDSLLVDGVGPLRLADVRYREFERRIAQRRGVQDGGVEKRHGDRQRRSVAHVEFLGVGDQFVERPAPGGIHLVLVAEDVVDAHAAVCTDLAEGKGVLFEEIDEEGT